MIKVLLERRVRRKNLPKLMEYLKDIRSAALRQPGYVTGETLVRGDDPVDVLVIGTWISEEHWKAWSTSQERIELEDMICSLLEEDVKVSVYKIPSEEE
ncbi:MAG: antibiotic biosynthesis monooxygenase [Chloroflexota bacterium]